jgi:hypothetical protein
MVLFFGKSSWWPSFYHPGYFSIVFLSSAFFIILPKYIFKPRNECQQESIILLRTIMAIAFLLNALGELYFYQLYKHGFQYDKVIHLVIPILFVFGLTSFFVAWKNFTIKKALKISMAIVLVGSFLWEFFEYLSDLIFKTSVFGVYGQYKFSDTAYDLICDLLGVIFSSIILSIPRASSKIINDYCRRPLLTGKKVIK